MIRKEDWKKKFQNFAWPGTLTIWLMRWSFKYSAAFITKRCRSQLTCALCTVGVKRTGFGPKGVVVCSCVYLLGGWKRLVGETMLGSENNRMIVFTNEHLEVKNSIIVWLKQGNNWPAQDEVFCFTHFWILFSALFDSSLFFLSAPLVNDSAIFQFNNNNNNLFIP